MGRGSYLGGSTIISPPKKRKKKKGSIAASQLSTTKKTSEQKEAELQERIRLAAERLAKTQAEFDAGVMVASKKAKKSAGPKLSQRKKMR